MQLSDSLSYDELEIVRWDDLILKVFNDTYDTVLTTLNMIMDKKLKEMGIRGGQIKTIAS